MLTSSARLFASRAAGALAVAAAAALAPAPPARAAVPPAPDFSPPPGSLASPLVDDFDDGDLVAVSGLSWMVIADDQLGGESAATVESVAPGAAGSRRALRLSGRVADGFPTPFAGAWTALAEGGVPVDLRRYAGFRFRARGGGGTFQAGLRRNTRSRAANYMHPFVAPAGWTAIEVPFSDLEQAGSAAAPRWPWRPTEVAWIGFTTAPGASGEFALEVDAVELIPAAAGVRSPAAGGDDEGGGDPPPTRAVRLRLTPPPALAGLRWTRLAGEEIADGARPRLPDAASLAVARDPIAGLVWFKLDLVRPLDPAWFGVNLALDVDGDPADGTPWWGPSNREFRFDRLVTAWLSRTEGVYQGVVGVASAAGAAAGTLDDLAAGGLRVVLADDRRWLAVGVPRNALGPPGGGPVRLVATVGSSFLANDDLPDRGAVAVALD